MQYLFIKGERISIAEAVSLYANIYRITEHQLEARNKTGKSLDDFSICLGNKNLNWLEAKNLLRDLAITIININTGSPDLDDICKSIIGNNVLLPEQVVPLVVSEIHRLEIEYESRRKKAGEPDLSLSPEGTKSKNTPRMR